MATPTKRQRSTIKHEGRTIYLNNKELLIALKESNEQGKMTDTLAKMLQKLCAKYATIGKFVNYCVDDQTEALTQNGWKSHEELTKDDVILSYDTDTKQLTWSQIFDIYKNAEYDGLMHKLTTQGMDALVTPNHKFVSSERGIIPVEDIICNEHIVLTGLPVEQSLSIHNDYFVELVGWAITEGQFSTKGKNKHAISISQKVGPKADRIRECLNNLQINHKEYTRNDIVIFNCTGSIISNIYQTITPNRVLSNSFIVSLTQSQKLLLIHTMVEGDGWTRPSGELAYSQKCKLHTDAFLMLCTLAGLTTSTKQITCTTPVSKTKPNGGFSQVYQVIIYDKPKLQCKAESINFHGGKQIPGGVCEDKPNLPTVQYKGTIWCPQTEYGTFMCRRNGQVYITGNTYNDDMQGYAMLMLVRTWKSFDAEKGSNPFAFFTQCIKHSFIQYLNQEKRHRNIRDTLMVQQGLSASFGFMDDSDQHFVDDEQDYEYHKTAATELYQYNTATEENPIVRNEIGEVVDIVDFNIEVKDNIELTF